MSSTLIFGANGFVGSSIKKELIDKHKYSVVCPAHSKIDLLDCNSVKDYIGLHNDVSIIFHCVSFGGSRINDYDKKQVDVMEKNLRMFFNVARCIQPWQRLVFMGSGAEYGREHHFSKIPELYFDTYVPNDSYGYAKYVISQYITSHKNMLDLRIFGLYGLGEDYRFKFISNAIVKALMGLPITIAQNVLFDYLYMGDFVRLVEKLMQVDWPYRHMNITPTESIDLLSIAKIINEVTENEAGIRVLNPGINNEYTGNNSKLLEVVGSFDFTSYRQSIIELVDYYRSVWDSLDLAVVRADPYLDKCIVKK